MQKGVGARMRDLRLKSPSGLGLFGFYCLALQGLRLCRDIYIVLQNMTVQGLFRVLWLAWLRWLHSDFKSGATGFGHER